MLEKLPQDWQEKAKKWAAGYEKMLERAKTSMQEVKAEQGPKVSAHIESAKHKAVELGELSEQEAEKIATYLQRDINDAAQFMTQAKKRFQDWLMLDWETVEDKLLEACHQVADKTVIEWQRLRQHLPLAPTEYKSGEMTGIGTLKCTSCKQEMKFAKVSRIPPCPKCHKTSFERLQNVS